MRPPVFVRVSFILLASDGALGRGGVGESLRNRLSVSPDTCLDHFLPPFLSHAYANPTKAIAIE